MKLSEIWARIRDYPRLQFELAISQAQAERLQRENKRLKKENDELNDAGTFQEEELSSLRSQREAYTAALKAIGPLIQSGGDAKLLYECISPCLDREGFTLYRIAERITGFDLHGTFPYEADCGQFVMSDGNELMRYLEAYQFGGVSWEIVPRSTYERGVLKEIDRSKPEFRAYEKQIYSEALRALGFESLLREESTQKQTEQADQCAEEDLFRQEETVCGMMMTTM